MKGNKHTGQYCHQCGQELTSWEIRCNEANIYQNLLCESCITEKYDISVEYLREIMEGFFGIKEN